MTARAERWTRPGAALLVIALVLLVWYLGHVLLVIFAGILLAVALSSAADGLAHWSPLNRGISLFVVAVLAIAGLVGLGFLVVPAALEELWTLLERLTEIASDLQQWMGQLPLVEGADGNGGNGNAAGNDSNGDALTESLMGSVQDAAGAAAGALFSILGALGTVLIVTIIGGFVAVNPPVYISGMLKLVPEPRRARASQTLAAIGHGLRWWLLGQLVSMAVLGVSTGIGLFAIGIDLWLGLALLTAVLTFIPFLGPIIAGVPIVAIAFGDGFETGLIVLVFYLALQNVEGNILTPMIQERAVRVPPALLVSMQVLFGAIFGAAGFIMAAPLTVVGFIAVNMLYVEDVLGDEAAGP